VRDIPVLGWLFRGFSRQDVETELVVVVNPAIVRDRTPDVNLWSFPDVWAPVGVTREQ
jgi:type II secretory pathway component GspD/PulD (secretin)